LVESRTAVVLDGSSLTVGEIVSIGRGERAVTLDPGAIERCIASRSFLEEEVAAGKVIYGVNTSFGPMCNKIISDEEIEALQVNLIRSHAAGLGDPLDPAVATAVTAVRLNTLVKGYSGVRIELLEALAEMINRGIAPYIPENGSVGASGDLTHLAHLALGVIGEGQLFYKGRLRRAQEVLAEEGLTPVRLAFKEGLAMMNGTAAATAIAAFAVHDARRLLNLACVTGAFGIEVFAGLDDAFDEDLHRVKPHRGQQHIADTIRLLCRDSSNVTSREGIHSLIRQEETTGPVYETSLTVQDVYSIRCTPQILAPVVEAIDEATRVLEVEANSTNDNPLVFPEQRKVVHGGNFHGQSVGFVSDMLAIAVSTLCNLSERRIAKYLDVKLNQGLPEFLIAGTVGLTMGFMGSQYLATSTTAENRQLANPVSTLTISTNAANQDVVPMSPVAARKALRAVENAKHILTLEVLVAMQALSFRGIDGLGTGTGQVHAVLDEHFEQYDNNRVLHDDLVRFRSLLFSSNLLDDLSGYLS
jgi:histidine ammonia-lyase